MNINTIFTVAVNQTNNVTKAIQSFPNSANSSEIEDLKAQIEFLQQTNSLLGSNFQTYVQSIYYSIFIVSIIIGILASIATFIFWKTLKETKETAKEIAEREVYKSVGNVLEREIRIVQRSIEKEKIIDLTRVNYVLQAGGLEPEICRLVRKRDFKDVKYYVDLNKIDSNYEVLVLDFLTKTFSEAQQRRIINNVINIYRKSLTKFTLVIYISSAREKRLSSDLQALIDNNGIYSTPANSPITLMGRIVDAAQMSYSLK